MTKFCRKCGSKLDDTTNLCLNCDAGKIKRHYNKKTDGKVFVFKEDDLDIREKKRTLKVGKKVAKKKKRANWSTGKKVRRFFLKLILTVLLLVIFAVGITGTLVYFDVVNISFLFGFNQNSLLELVNEKRIIVEEKNIMMTSETEGTATIVVTLPDYESLFESAVTAENPDNYLLKALFFKDYKTQEFELSANVTVKNGEQVIHSDEVVHQLLEERLVDAINAVSEVR